MIRASGSCEKYHDAWPAAYSDMPAKYMIPDVDFPIGDV
jgi:hypothetical protein